MKGEELGAKAEMGFPKAAPDHKDCVDHKQTREEREEVVHR